MTMTKSEKFLLALMICGSLTTAGIARAEDEYDITTYTDRTGETITKRETLSSVSTVNYDDCTFEVSGSAEDGGAIYSDHGTITYIRGELSVDAEGNVTSTSSFTNNTATNRGGAIFNYYNSSIGEISNTLFEGNTAVYGGAICNYAVATIGEISNSVFKGNTVSYNGGAIYNDTATIGEISDTLFEGNKANRGGAIFNYLHTTTTISITSIKGELSVDAEGNVTSTSTFKNNRADAGGGAIYNSRESSIGSIEGTVFETNYGGTGGAILLSETASIGTITNSFFTGNTALVAGAIYNGGTISEISGGAFTNNEASSTNGGAIVNRDTISEISDVTFTSNTAGGSGGAIYSTGTISEISDATFTSNTSGGSGGAIYNTGTIEISSGTFMNNKANSGDGGAIYNSGAKSEISDVTFMTNISGSSGGAIYNTGTIEISSSAFTSNNASTGNGGAIYNSGTLGIKDTTFESNTALTADKVGGAVYNDSTGSITEISGSTFKGNYAYLGSAIYNSDGGKISSIENTAFESNTVLGDHGGAIYNDATIGTISGSTFTSNTANQAGGAIYNGGTISEISDTSFTSNKIGNGSVGQGGAIYNDNDSTIGTISGSTFTSNAANGGSAIYNRATINKITDSFFIENSAANANGGAIYNSESATIDEISGSQFTGNTAARYGGAIYTIGTLNGISDSYFIGNSATGLGGAIYTTSDISSISGSSFENNSVVSESGDAKGGAIYSEGTISSIMETSFANNSAVSASGVAKGGAFYNTKATETFFWTGSLTGNYAKGATGAAGGAIYDEQSISVVINGDVSGNYVEVTGEGDVAGGVIYLQKAVDGETTAISVAGKVTGNHAETASGTASGGAFYNYENSTLVLNGGEISGNYVIATGEAKGGAIYNAGTLTMDSVERLSGNYATSSEGNAYGGAIYNENTDRTFTVAGNITGNHVSASGDAYGGAIYTTGDVNITADGADISISDNSATGNDAKGGAIYTTGDVSIAANGANILISGNSANGAANAIYMAADENGNTGSLKFTITNGGSITLEDTIKGEGEYTVVISGDGVNSSTFYLLNDLDAVDESNDASPISTLSDTIDYYDNANLSVGNVTINTLNNISHAYVMESFTLTNDVNMVVDVDLADETMDRISAGSYDAAGHTLTVSGMLPTSYTGKDSVAIYFADPDLMSSVQSSVTTVTAYTPIYGYDYNVYYVYNDNGNISYNGETVGTASDSNLISDDGGYFVFQNQGRNDDGSGDGTGTGSGDGTGTGSGDGSGTGTGDGTGTGSGDGSGSQSGGGSGSQGTPSRFNPAVMATSVATMGAYNAMGLMYESNFEHSDYFMKLPAEERLAMSEVQKRMKKAPKENDATKPAYYNQHELTERGVWMRTFASSESVDYDGGWESRDKYYGAMVGFDSSLREHGNGWASVFTGYAGSMGIRQTYSGGHIKQHGAFIGATASFYKKNFYTAWTIAAGTTKANEHTMYGHDNSRLDEYGIAGRFGWNIKLGDGKFSLLPTFTASFTYINPEDYTNAGGVHISGDGFYAVQLNPNVKFIWNMDKGWQPYLTVGEVWTVGKHSDFNATWAGQTYKLDELDLDPYTEYGIGIQKRWANERDAYVQVLGHSHGRDGILVNAGIRWNF